MSKILLQKRALLEKVYDFTRNDSFEKSLNGISNYIERKLLDDYKFHLSYKSFEGYYKSIVVYEKDCTIKIDTLNKLSEYIGYNDFKDFCEKEFNQPLVSEKDNPVLEEISITLHHIKETLSTGLSYLMTGRNSFGFLGIIIVAGIFLNKFVYQPPKKIDNSSKDSIITVIEPKQNQKIYVPRMVMQVPSQDKSQILEKSEIKRQKECMYWHEDHYEAVFCDEIIDENLVIALNREKMLMKKINSPDTLTVENALGKVWYDKSNKKIEFFTHYGIHPENGKTLKPITAYILETYAKK